jgi:hypothetical protein
MAVMTGGRVRTAPGTAVVAALILVLAFGNPAYVDWVNRNANANSAWGFFLHTLAWPTWSFSSKESVQTLLANDIKALLLIILTGVFVALMVGSRGFLAGWGGYIFAAAVAGFLAAFIQVNASLLGAFTWAAGGAVYGLFVGWIVGLAAAAGRAA